MLKCLLSKEQKITVFVFTLSCETEAESTKFKMGFPCVVYNFIQPFLYNGS